MVTAFCAADFPPVGKREIEQKKQRLANIGIALAASAQDIWEAGNDALLITQWRGYQYKYPSDAPVHSLPDHLLDVAMAINSLGDFFQEVAPDYNYRGPVTPVGQPNADDARKTIVIRHIARVCQRHFGTPLYSTVATLANASLARNDITRSTVQGSLRADGTPDAGVVD